MKRRRTIFRRLLITILTLTCFTPALYAQETEDKSELAQTLIVKVTGKKNFGAGIIFSVRGGYLFIATAYHVVRGSDGVVDVEFEFDRKVTVKAKLINNSPRLDLAVLQVDIQDSRLQGLPLAEIPFELLKSVPSLQEGMEVFPIGHPAGKEWYIPRNPGIIREVIFDADILFEFECYPGHSGGGIFTKDWNLAGMILQKDLYDCNALSFKRIYATLKELWKLEVSQDRIRSLVKNTPTPTPLPTPSATDKKIQQLLKKADAYFARQWYTTPEATSALPIYLEVLSLDPFNVHALEKIDWMADYYKGRAEKELKRGRKAQSIQAYQTYLKIMPNDEEVLDRLVELTAIPTPFPTATPTTKPTATPKPQATATPKQKATATPEPLPTATPHPTDTPEAATAPIAGQEYHDPVSGIDFVWIPEGCFQMGHSDEDKRYLLPLYSEENYKDYFADEFPQHTVCLDGFWMGKTEVTQAQWKKFMDKNPANFQGDSRPVEQVSWNDTQDFFKKLNAEAGQELYRLPSEAEWEYAARAGTQTIFSFGNDASQLGNYAWYSDNSNSETHPVGQLNPNPWGLYDMHGNVWEWCQDWYAEDYYSNSPKDTPKGPSSGVSRVLRGGSWYDDSHDCRSAFRNRVYPDSRYSSNGFRVVVGVVAWALP